MEKIIIVHLILALIATGFLLTQKSPRITSMGWIVAIWTIYLLGWPMTLGFNQ